MARSVTAGPCALATLLVLGGCAPGDAPGAATFSVRDSAGIEIVESAEPVWREGEGWRVSAEPILDVGRTEGEQPYLLDQVMGVVRLDDGGIVVANMGDNTLRFFDARGSFVRSVGGRGGGPGEFFQLMSLTRVGEALYAGQFAEYPTHVYDFGGTLLRSIVPVGIAGVASQSVGVLADGTQIYMSWPQGRQVQPTGTWIEDLAIYRLAPDGATADSLIARPATRFSAVLNRYGNYVVFGPIGHVRAAGDRIYYGFTERYEIEVHDREGVLRRRIGRAWTPDPVTDDQVANYREALIGAEAEGGGPPPPQLVEWRRTLAEQSAFAEHHPAFGRVVVDRTGGLWLERNAPDRTPTSTSFNPTYAAPTEWDVFDARGAWLGVVATPPAFVVLEIGADYIAGIWRDDIDVDHVRVYALEKD